MSETGFSRKHLERTGRYKTLSILFLRSQEEGPALGHVAGQDGRRHDFRSWALGVASASHLETC